MASPVRGNWMGTLLGVAWMAFLSFVGCGLGGASFWFEWGFCGYGVSGLLLLGSVFGIAGMLVGGGSWTAACPSCGQVIRSGDTAFQRRQDKILACPHCATWVHGKASLEIVPDGYVHPHPVFEAPLPDRFSWPDGCPTCGEPVTRRVKVEGRSAAGTTAMAASPAGVQRVLVIEAPACDRHGDGTSASRGDGKGDRVQFRSFDYWRNFTAANPAA